jgi:chromosome segregation ATPase
VRERTASPADERHQREALEELQSELKRTRAALATASAEAERTAASLLTALEEAKARRDATSARVEALKAERASIQPELNALEDRLVAKRKEDALLARGAKLRNVYVDWNPGDRQNAVSDGFTVEEVKWGAIVIGTIFLILIIVASVS